MAILAAMLDHGTITFAHQLSGRLTTIGPGLADLDLTADGATPLGSVMRIAIGLSFVTEHRFRGRGTLPSRAATRSRSPPSTTAT